MGIKGEEEMNNLKIADWPWNFINGWLFQALVVSLLLAGGSFDLDLPTKVALMVLWGLWFVSLTFVYFRRLK